MSAVDLARSIKDRLVNRAREQQEDSMYVFIRFGLERFLYRLSKSRFADTFVLKGAMMFLVWHENYP